MQLRLSTKSIWLSHKAVDFRKSIDGLSALVNDYFSTEVNEGVYVFYNRHRDKLKLLCWHGNGFVLLYKRLSRGKFHVLRDAISSCQLSESELQWLLSGLDWQTQSHWQSLGYTDFS